MGDLSTTVLIQMMQKINEDFDKETVMIHEYAACLNMWVQSLKHLGAAIAVAFQDTKDKSACMKANREFFVNELKLIDATAPEANYLFAFCHFEATQKCQNFNGDYKNKKPLKAMNKSDIQPWMPKYTATSRHLWRNQWLFTFLGSILSRIVNE